MSTSAATVRLDFEDVLSLLDHIAKLKALHRAGESPVDGQIEDLFDRAAVLRDQVLASHPMRPSTWPAKESASAERLARQFVTAMVTALRTLEP